MYTDMLHFILQAIFALCFATCFNRASSLESADKPCTLSYFDLWNDADIILTSTVESVGHSNETCRVKIEKILKRPNINGDHLKIPIEQNIHSLDKLQCDGRYRIGQTRVVFATFGENGMVRVLRFPKMRSWLLVLLQSIGSQGEILKFSLHMLWNTTLFL